VRNVLLSAGLRVNDILCYNFTTWKARLVFIQTESLCFLRTAHDLHILQRLNDPEEIKESFKYKNRDPD
jgi:hypothetical protein